jgi:hypothetical protein
MYKLYDTINLHIGIEQNCMSFSRSLDQRRRAAVASIKFGPWDATAPTYVADLPNREGIKPSPGRSKGIDAVPKD